MHVTFPFPGSNNTINCNISISGIKQHNYTTEFVGNFFSLFKVY